MFRVKSQKKPTPIKSGNQHGAIENFQPERGYPSWRTSVNTLTGYKVSEVIHILLSVKSSLNPSRMKRSNKASTKQLHPINSGRVYRVINMRYTASRVFIRSANRVFGARLQCRFGVCVPR